MLKPELLAPAGGRDALIAAVQSGADAVYLGAGSFNARQSADNFGGNALADAISYAHVRGVRVHVTLNTLVREDERPALIQAIEEIAAAGADAVLVQDFGGARLAREIAPDMPLHASTQMAAHNRSAVQFLAEHGFARAVLAREMNLAEIRACAGLGIETEVFVHGALCIACSGQCLFSSLVGGRSGNRGRCAQPCRLPYRMDGREGYLLSTRDLCAIDRLDDLAGAGVASLKIEGRLKRPEYVSTVVRAYRAALDHAIAPDESTIQSLRQMFNRGGFTEGYIPGVSDTRLIYSARPNHLGVETGKCVQSGKIRLSADLDPSDALALRAPAARNPLPKADFSHESAQCIADFSDCMETLAPDRPIRLTGRAGETVACPEARSNFHRANTQRAANSSDCMEMLAPDRPIRLTGRAGETVACPEARKGDALIRLVSEAQMRSAREYCADEHRAIDVNARLILRVGQPLELIVTDGAQIPVQNSLDAHRANGNTSPAESDCDRASDDTQPPLDAHCANGETSPAESDCDSDSLPSRTAIAFGAVVERAQNRGANPERVRAQLEKTGGTACRMRQIELDMDSDAFCPISALNALRRDALEKLNALRAPRPYALHAPRPIAPLAHTAPAAPEIMLESANPAVLAHAGDGRAIFSPEDVRLPALDAALELLPAQFFLAPPMVLGEKSLQSLNAWANAHSGRIAGVYLTNIGQFALSWPGALRADFSLNAANRAAIRQLRDWGVGRIAPSVELTSGQIALLDGELELIVHGYLPLMHLRHCPYRTTHELPGPHALCRRCDSCSDPVTGKTLTDRTGAQFTLRRVATDEGCIVRILNSVPLMLLRRANRLPKANAWRIRTEDACEAEALLRLYALAARGADFKSDGAWAKYESLPATTGHFFRGVE